ncbi:hypothetical protein BC826DRAFT_48865 [Russula brevipes]|nr:hypothetical protein BC826DRAFT_48865 [Russula brevipes]
MYQVRKWCGAPISHVTPSSYFRFAVSVVLFLSSSSTTTIISLFVPLLPHHSRSHCPLVRKEDTLTIDSSLLPRGVGARGLSTLGMVLYTCLDIPLRFHWPKSPHFTFLPPSLPCPQTYPRHTGRHRPPGHPHPMQPSHGGSNFGDSSGLLIYVLKTMMEEASKLSRTQVSHSLHRVIGGTIIGKWNGG